MKLKIGELGIESMYNSHTKSKRDEIHLTRKTKFKGPLSCHNNIVDLGYNESIACDTKANASNVLDLISRFFNK